jgi:hypothetical protein
MVIGKSDFDYCNNKVDKVFFAQRETLIILTKYKQNNKLEMVREFQRKKHSCNTSVYPVFSGDVFFYI